MVALVLIMTPIIITVSAVVRGYVLSSLWAWFVVPTFELPEIPVAVAMGLALIVGYLTHQEHKSGESDDDPKSTYITACFTAVLQPLLALGIGALIHAFV